MFPVGGKDTKKCLALGSLLWEGDREIRSSRTHPHIRKRGDSWRSSPASPIGRTRRAKRSFAHSSTPIALSMTSLVAPGQWRQARIQSTTRVRENRPLPPSIFTTSTSRPVRACDTRRLLTGPFDAAHANDPELRRRLTYACGATRLPRDRFLRRIERARLRCNIG